MEERKTFQRHIILLFLFDKVLKMTGSILKVIKANFI